RKRERRKCFADSARLLKRRWVKTFLLFSRLEIWHSAVSMPPLITQLPGTTPIAPRTRGHHYESRGFVVKTFAFVSPIFSELACGIAANCERSGRKRWAASRVHRRASRTAHSPADASRSSQPAKISSKSAVGRGFYPA